MCHDLNLLGSLDARIEMYARNQLKTVTLHLDSCRQNPERFKGATEFFIQWKNQIEMDLKALSK